MKKFTSHFERFEIELTKEQVLACSHQGECYYDCKDVLGELNLEIDPSLVRDELKEYGAWSDEELSDDNENLIKAVWIAAGDIKESKEIEKYEMIQAYENPELCEKFNNNIPANELEFVNEMFLTDSQDIDALCNDFPFLPIEDITGFITSVKDGDYGEVYVTESGSPYSYDAIYHPLSYYL